MVPSSPTVELGLMLSVVGVVTEVVTVVPAGPVVVMGPEVAEKLSRCSMPETGVPISPTAVMAKSMRLSCFWKAVGGVASCPIAGGAVRPRRHSRRAGTGR
jgi:hypothetical protein